MCSLHIIRRDLRLDSSRKSWDRRWDAKQASDEINRTRTNIKRSLLPNKYHSRSICILLGSIWGISLVQVFNWIHHGLITPFSAKTAAASSKIASCISRCLHTNVYKYGCEIVCAFENYVFTHRRYTIWRRHHHITTTLPIPTQASHAHTQPFSIQHKLLHFAYIYVPPSAYILYTHTSLTPSSTNSARQNRATFCDIKSVDKFCALLYTLPCLYVNRISV